MVKIVSKKKKKAGKKLKKIRIGPSVQSCPKKATVTINESSSFLSVFRKFCV